MELAEALVAHLTANAGVTAQLGTRVYPLLIPVEATLPALAYQQVSSVEEISHDGQLVYHPVRYQLTVQGKSYKSAVLAMRVVKDCLRGYRGVMGGVGGMEIHGAFIENESDTNNDEGDRATVRVDVVFMRP